MIVACPNCQTRFSVPAPALQPDGRQVRCSQCHHSWFQEPRADPARTPGPAPRAASRPEPEPQPQPQPARPARPARPAEPPPAAARRTEARRTEARPAAVEEPYQAEDLAEAEDAADWDEPDPGSYDLTELDGEPIPQLPIQTRARVNRKKVKKRSGLAIGWYALLVAIVAVLAGLYFGRAQLVEVWPPIERLYVTAGIGLPQPPLTLDFRDTATSFEDQDTTLVVSGKVSNSGPAAQAVPAVEVVLLDGTGTALVTRAVKTEAAILQPGGTTAFAARFENYPPSVADLRLSFALPAK